MTALLSHYYQPEVSDEADMLMLADWLDALSDLPQEAVERAIRERILSAERARPLPGEIRARAKAFLAPAERPRLALVQEDQTWGKPISEEHAERLNRIAREMGRPEWAIFTRDAAAPRPRVKRMPRAIDPRTGEDGDS